MGDLVERLRLRGDPESRDAAARITALEAQVDAANATAIADAMQISDLIRANAHLMAQVAAADRLVDAAHRAAELLEFSYGEPPRLLCQAIAACRAAKGE